MSLLIKGFFIFEHLSIVIWDRHFHFSMKFNITKIKIEEGNKSFICVVFFQNER